jgi:hypothetical protein
MDDMSACSLLFIYDGKALTASSPNGRLFAGPVLHYFLYYELYDVSVK